MKPRNALLLVVSAVSLTALSVLVAAGPPPAASPASRVPRWEYARIAADGDTYVLTTTNAIYRIELPQVEPQNDGTVYEIRHRLLEKRFDRRLYALNLLAADGWEIDPGAELKQGEWYLTRRLR